MPMDKAPTVFVENQWYVADIDDIGACLGEGHPHPANSKD